VAFCVNKSHAQYSCQTATQLIVKDSLELDSFAHSGYDDRWFAFNLTDSIAQIAIQWEWENSNAIVPYDTLFIYTNTCGQLVLHDAVSPIPNEMDFVFQDVNEVFLRFVRADSVPAFFYFDLVLLAPLECECIPKITLSKDVICLGECIILTNETVICNHDDKNYSLTITPTVTATHIATTWSQNIGTLVGGYDYQNLPNFILPYQNQFEICPLVAGVHTVHASFYGTHQGSPVFCEVTKTFTVYDQINLGAEIVASSAPPCELTTTTINNEPAYQVPCCVNQIDFQLNSNDPTLINSIHWVFHDHEDYYQSTYSYSNQTWYNNQSGNSVTIQELFANLGLNCFDTFYLSAFIEHICDEEIVTMPFILTAPELDFTATTVCLGNQTNFYPTIDPDCVESWTWDFGNGHISSSASPLQNVSHLYTAPGDYQVSLTVYYFDNQCSATANHTVSVILVEKPEFSIPWEWACADEIVFTIENYNPSFNYYYTIDDPFATYMPLPVPGTSSPLPQVEIPWAGMSGGILYTHVYDDSGCYAYDSLMIFNCCIDPLTGDFYYNHTFSGNQTISGQNLYLNGTIDFATLSNYQYIDCNFYFSPNTKVIVPDLANVSINKSGHLQACDTLMWDGIYVFGSGSLAMHGSSPDIILIQDAKHAVVSENGGHYSIYGTTFDKNYNHLAVYSLPCEAHTGEIFKSELICSDFILPQYPPIIAHRTRFAIEVAGVKNLTIGRTGSSDNRNRIENCDVGIYSWNSMITVTNNYFNNIKPLNLPPTPNPGFLPVPSHPKNYAIYSHASPIGLPVCNGMPAMYQRGITTMNTHNFRANRFANCYRGIFMHDNQTVNLGKNDFINNENVPGLYAIEFSSFFYQSQKYVTANLIEGYRYGIFATNTRFLNINSNVIRNMYLPNFPFGNFVATGIQVRGGNSNAIYSNTVNNSDKPLNIRNEGIRVVQSASSLTMCNSLVSLGKAIRYGSNCVPAEIKLNKMNNSILGYCLADNGYTGQQGTINEPWDNEWHGTFTHHLYTMNNTNGQALINHWYIHEQQGSPKHPNGFSTWYDLTGTPLSFNTTSGMLWPELCAVVVFPHQIQHQILFDEIALDQVEALIEPEYRRWMSRDGLMKTIDANPHLLESPVLQNFRIEQQFESTGQLEIVLDTVSKGYIEEGILLNDAIMTISEPDFLAKEVNQIMLNANFINSQFFADAFDTTAVAQLQEYAHLCPFVYGNYVFVCRVMLQMIGDTTEYWHDCEEDSDFRHDRALPIDDTISQLKIYPNPASDYVTIETDMPLPATLYLYNSMGQKIDEIQIVDTITVLDVSKYKKQIIFYYINGKTGKISLMQ
jgi:PKD repeat protein